MIDRTDPSITIAAYEKNEGRFLLEWIAYHRVIGVTDILIYTNNCEDKSPELLDRLTEMGLVKHERNPVQPDEKPQNIALSLAGGHPAVLDADYVLQIDIDEFLCIKTGEGRLPDLIATGPGADAFCIQMRFFGDNGLTSLPDGPVLESLTGASVEDFRLNNIVKTLARNTPVFKQVAANHMPQFGFKKRPRLFNGGGTEISPEAYNFERFRTIPDAFRSMRHAQLNHYAVRTFSDYRAKKYRGTAADNDAKLHMGYWNARNRNEVQDRTALRHLPAAKELMETWLKDPVLGARNRRCFEAYAEILKKSENIFVAKAGANADV